MNKKYMMFGVLGLFAMALVSAGIVSYLSNTTNVDIGVKSPLELENTVTYPHEDDVAYGGEVIHIDATITNRANVPVSGQYVMNISAVPIIANENFAVGFTDFETIEMTSGSTTYTALESDVSIDGTGIVVTMPSGVFTSEATSSVVYDVRLTFAQDVEPATYTITSVVNIATA